MADDRDKEVEGSDLSAIIAQEIRQSEQYEQSELSSRRANAIAYMRGDVSRDLPTRVNGSSLTSRDLSDIVGWILPGIVRVFTASDQMVQYDKVQEEQDDWSREASEYTNYTFFRESDGYRVLLNATHDSLVLGDGVACSYWEPPRFDTKTFRNKLPEELAMLMEEGWEPAGDPRPGETTEQTLQDPLTGEEIRQELPTWTIKARRQSRPGRICDITCRPENLLVNSTATTIEDARFVAYLHDDKTRSDLLEMADDYGWDEEVIKELPAYARASTNEVATARRVEPIRRDSPHRSGDPIGLYECYLRADIDDDGIAELVRVWYAGDTILGHEEWDDEIPYTTIPCYPVPHNFWSEGVYDRTADIMLTKTVLLRQGVENIYASNMPMREVVAGSVLNPDILVHPKFAGIIWKKTGSDPIVPHTIPYVADKVFSAMQYADEMLAKRTGVSRQTMALDPEALQNQTATANQNARDAGYSQIELIARNQAELGWSRFFDKRLKLATKYQQVRKIPSKKEESGFKEIDPGQWDRNMAVSINVGLGTGSRDRDMAMLNSILAGQIGMADRLGQAGLTNKALEFLKPIRMTAVQLAESSGIKDPEEYYPPIDDDEIEEMKAQAAEPQPDPQIELEKMKIEAQGELEKLKLEILKQSEELKAQGNAVKEKAQLEADIQTKTAERETSLLLDQQKQRFELEKVNADIALRLKEMDIKKEIELLKLGLKERAENEAAGKEGGTVIKPSSEMMIDDVAALRAEMTKKLQDIQAQTTAQLQQVAQMLAAPVQAIRGPDGKISGAQRVMPGQTVN